MSDRGQELSDLWHGLIDVCRESDPAHIVDTGALLASLARDHHSARSVVAACNASVEVLDKSNVALEFVERGNTRGATRAVWESLFIGQDLWMRGPIALYPFFCLASPRHRLKGTRPTRASLLFEQISGGYLEVVRNALLAAGAQADAKADWDAWGARHVLRRDFRDVERMRRLYAAEIEDLPTMALAYLDAKPEEIAWMAEALRDGRKWLVAVLAEQTGHLHTRLECPMADAGALEANPSYNRTFIEIAMWASGPATVLDRYQELMASGDEEAQSGASQALYWVQAVGNLALPARELAALFLKTTSIDTQRRLIGNLTCRPLTNAREDDRVALTAALAAARKHSDEYVRHRVAIFDGAEKLLAPLPPREDS